MGEDMNELDELRKRCGKRYAYEWFMRAEDERYWTLTQRLVAETKRKITVLIGVSTVISLITLILFVLFCFVS